MKVAIVHERFTEVAGSEQVVEQFALQWPRARVFAPIAQPGGVPAGIANFPTTSWLDRMHRMGRRRSYAPLLPLMPRAFRRMPLGDADVVVVSHHAFATQAVFASSAPTVAYVHSPARWAWDKTLRAGEAGGRLGETALTLLARTARKNELAAAPKLHTVVANSTEVASRIKKLWNRESVVVHPPVDTESYFPDRSIDREDFFLLAGRLVPYKRPDIAIQAATLAGVRLVVAGDGRYRDYCESIAGPNVTFAGRVTGEEFLDLHRRSRALLMPGLEDFGIVPVEAMACGSPVIALGAGGALDTVIPGLSGALVENGDDGHVIEGFAKAMTEFEPADYDNAAIRAHAEGFSEATFREKMQAVLDCI